ncbi:MAG: PEP-CTERM sorting domain-containing protein [Cyanobacteria bacterium P01_F01_bin.33]
MNAFLKVSAAVLGSAVLSTTLATSSARAATIVQSVSASDDSFSISGGIFPFAFDIPDVPFDKFDTSLGTLNSVSAAGSLTYDFTGTCSNPLGCTVAIDASASVPQLSFSDSFTGGITLPPGTISDSDTLSGSIGLAPPLPLSFFEGVADEPLLTSPVGSVSGTLAIDPLASAIGSFDVNLDLIYDFTPVPEPATTAGLAIAGAMGFLAKRKKSVAADKEQS